VRAFLKAPFECFCDDIAIFILADGHLRLFIFFVVAGVDLATLKARHKRESLQPSASSPCALSVAAKARTVQNNAPAKSRFFMKNPPHSWLKMVDRSKNLANVCPIVPRTSDNDPAFAAVVATSRYRMAAASSALRQLPYAPAESLP
jgi:hypothetical protein